MSHILSNAEMEALPLGVTSFAIRPLGRAFGKPFRQVGRRSRPFRGGT